nr:MAG TPA: hypothetical protein [Caudoviricetes sp.]
MFSSISWNIAFQFSLQIYEIFSTLSSVFVKFFQFFCNFLHNFLKIS